MNAISIEEAKQIQVALLKKVHQYCEENHLTYYLIDGTLLGAVRHKGFIPWDDDVDIAMPRKDYEAFFRNFGVRDNAEAINCDTRSDYYLPMGKVVDRRTVLKENVVRGCELGVYIDIFVLDYLPADTQIYQKKIQKLLLCRNLLSLNMQPGSNKRKGYRRIVHAVLRRVCFWVNANHVSKKMNRIARSMGQDEGRKEYVAKVCNIAAKEIQMKHPTEDFEERITVQFENEWFYAPSGYDRILREMYEDYMQLPPVEQRVTHHEYEQYWKD